VKKQETVEQRFENTRKSWEEGKKRKLSNIDQELESIDKKIQSLEMTRKELLVVRDKIVQLKAPQPPSESKRRVQAQEALFAIPEAERSVKILKRMEKF